VANNENYSRDQAKKLEKVLQACGWRQIERGLWEKGHGRLYVDEIGIFLYQFHNGQWLRTHGRSHNLITHLNDLIIHFDDFTLYL